MTAPLSTLPPVPTDVGHNSDDSNNNSNSNSDKSSSNRKNSKFEISKNQIRKSPKANKKKTPAKVSLSPGKKKVVSPSAESGDQDTLIGEPGHKNSSLSTSSSPLTSTTTVREGTATIRNTKSKLDSTTSIPAHSASCSTGGSSSSSSSSSKSTPQSPNSVIIRSRPKSNSKYRNKKFNRKTTATNTTTTTMTMIKASDEMASDGIGCTVSSVTEGDEVMGPGRQNLAGYENDEEHTAKNNTNATQVTSSSNTCSTKPISKEENSSFVKHYHQHHDQQQQSRRNLYKSYKGSQTRKSYITNSQQQKQQQHRNNNKSNKQINLVQERDVYDYEPNNNVDDHDNTSRTSSSPVTTTKTSIMNKIEDGITALNLNEEDNENSGLVPSLSTSEPTKSESKFDSKKTTNITDASLSKQYSDRAPRGGKYVTGKKGEKRHVEKMKVSLNQKNKAVVPELEVQSNIQCDATLQEKKEQIAKSDDSHNLLKKLHDDNKTADTDSRPSSPSSTSNLVTTNAAGEELLKRLGGSVTSAQEEDVAIPDGVTASREVDLDIDANTAFSGDVSGISMEQSQDYDQTMVYPNPIMFPPMPPSQQLRIPEVMIAPNGTHYGPPMSSPQQQWIMPLQSDMSPQQHEYNNMMGYHHHNQQQFQVYPTAMSPQYGLGSNIMQARPVPIPSPPNFYSQNFPVQMPMLPIYQQQQAMYSAPKPIKYEQVSIGGCVYFNPIYEVPGCEDTDVDNSIDTHPVIEQHNAIIDKNDNKKEHRTGNDVVVDDEQEAASNKQETKRRKNKFKRSKKKQYKRKSKEEKSNTE